jgi:hypothetical protein
MDSVSSCMRSLGTLRYPEQGSLARKHAPHEPGRRSHCSGLAFDYLEGSVALLSTSENDIESRPWMVARETPLWYGRNIGNK